MSSESDYSRTSNNLAEGVLHPTRDETSATAVQHGDHRNDVTQAPAEEITNNQQLDSGEPVTSLEDRPNASASRVASRVHTRLIVFVVERHPHDEEVFRKRAERQTGWKQDSTIRQTYGRGIAAP